MGGTTQVPKSSRIWLYPPIPTLQAPPFTQSLDETDHPHPIRLSTPKKWNFSPSAPPSHQTMKAMEGKGLII